MSWVKPIASKSVFFVSEYLPSPDGNMSPLSPDRCPSDPHGTFGNCRVVEHSFRDRKIGPSHPLVVFCCRFHRTFFTVYPPHYQPYGRRPLISSEEPSTFDSVVDAATGEMWSEEGASVSTPTRKTQNRWVKAWCLLLGTDPELTSNERHQLSVSLSLSRLVVEDAAKQIRAGPTTKGRALYTSRVVSSHIPTMASICRRGHQLGFWGERVSY